AEDAVLAVQDDLAIGRKVVGDQRRQADAQVHAGAVRDVARHARGHLVAVEPLHRRPPASVGATAAPRTPFTCTTRFTKMPGVTTASGSIAPSSTISDTCAIVH